MGRVAAPSGYNGWAWTAFACMPQPARRNMSPLYPFG